MTEDIKKGKNIRLKRFFIANGVSIFAGLVGYPFDTVRRSL